MDRQQIGVKLALNGLGRPLKVDSFDDRLILQKTIYLVQAKGIHLGYYYKWYLHGPYCSSLTKDLYAIDSESGYADEECGRWKLDDDSSKRLSDLIPLFSKNDTEGLANHLELLASVHFLLERKQVSKRNVKQIRTILKRYDKKFSANQIEEALGVLDKHGLFGN